MRLRFASFALLLGCAPTERAAPPPPPVVTRVAASTAPSAPPPSPPAYDLAADRDRIAARATDELGKTTRTEVVEDVFVLVAPPGWNARALASSTSITKSALGAYFNGRFDKHPERAVGVLLFPNETTYQTYCKGHLGGECDSPFGLYRPDLRAIVMNAGSGLGTLTHELVHPIVEADFPRAPTWINEGIASLFEAPVIPKTGEIHGAKNWRLPRLLAGMRSPEEKGAARLDALFGTTDDTFRGPREKLYYATARYVCQWLDERGWLWAFYHAYRDGFAADPTGRASFTRVTGMSPEDANAKWTAWVKRL